MKRVKFGIPIAVCLLALIVSCGPTEVGKSGEVVRQFYGHLNSGDSAAAMALYTNHARGMLEGQDGAVDFAKWVGDETRQSSIEEVKIISEKVNDAAGTSTVLFELIYAAGQPERRTVTMALEDGQWKLGFIDPA